MTDVNALPHRSAAAPASTQVFGTDGIRPLQRPGLIARTFLAMVARVERLNLQYSKVGNPCVYDNATFPWAAAIESEWPIIREELSAVLARKDELPSFQQISTDVATITQDQGWKTFLFSAFGVKSKKNIEMCPQTWRVLQKVPRLQAAMFSVFEPGKHLPAHRGPYNGVLRLHLGLVVPEPRQQVAIRVGEKVCHWEEGRVLIFDDAYEHEAWNRTDSVRVVLFVDFRKPLRFPASFLNWLVLNLAVFTPFIQEGHDRHRAWEQQFRSSS